MVNSIVIICEESPFGKDSVVESFRMATGLLAVGDIEDVKIILMKDAIYFLNKHLDPVAINANEFTNIMRLIEFSEIEVFLHDNALKAAGLKLNDIFLKENVKIVDIKQISKLILRADMTFKY
jgi:sulfur relay (sulfurtransferase) DsrF/TusC family protein